MLVRAIERAGLFQERMSRSRWTSRHRISAKAAAIAWVSKGVSWIATRWPRAARLGARYPIVSIEDPFAEDDDHGLEQFTAAMATASR